MDRNMIKAIFFDIDGTLVSFRTHEISKTVLDALYALREKDIRLFIASGRHLLIMDNLSGFPFDGYVCMNGSLIYDRGEVIYSHPLDREDAAAVIDLAETGQIPCVLFSEKNVAMNCRTERTEQLFRMIRLPEPEYTGLMPYKSGPVCQFTIFLDKAQENSLLTPVLKHSVTTRWHPEFTDIVPQNISKAEGIARVIAGYGIRQDEVMAFGDGGNDIEMIEYAGIGVAMGNALPDVQEHADYVTSTVDEDGVAAALRHFGVL